MRKAGEAKPVHFLHIGKTGGTAVKHALKGHVDTGYYKVQLHPHGVRLRDIPVGEKVFFILRDPISRFISGFNSRKRKGQPRHHFPWSPGEEIAFKLFDTPNALGKALLSENEEIRNRAVEAMHSIQHVNSTYSNWLESRPYFLSRIADIFSIGFQETLAADFAILKKKLGLPETVDLPQDEVQSHRSPRDLDTHLDKEVIENLQRYYADDYDFIELCRKWRQMAVPFTSPAFIIGVPRSGTTLLASLLNRHPDICVTPESHFFRHVKRFQNNSSDFISKWPDSGKELLSSIEERHYELFGTEPDEIIRQIDAAKPLPRDVFMKLGEVYAANKRKLGWIEKTPDHINYIKDIRNLFPDAKIIHIVRDGRDVAMSLCKTNWPWQSKSYVENLLQWSRSVKYAKDQLEADKNTYCLRFEDLLADPYDFLRQICNFLSIKFYEEMLIPDGSEQQLIEKGTLCKNNIMHPVNNQNSRKWEQNLSHEMKLLSQMISGDELFEYGYSVACQHNEEYAGNVRVPIGGAKIGEVLDKVLKYFVGKGLNVTCDTVKMQQWQENALDRFWLVGESFFEVLENQGRLHCIYILAYLRRKLSRMRARGIKLVWFYHGDESKTQSWKLRNVTERLVAQHASLIICNCQMQESCKTSGLFDVRGDVVTHNFHLERVERLF
jgi:hypothetical protein